MASQRELRRDRASQLLDGGPHGGEGGLARFRLARRRAADEDDATALGQVWRATLHYIGVAPQLGEAPFVAFDIHRQKRTEGALAACSSAHDDVDGPLLCKQS